MKTTKIISLIILILVSTSLTKGQESNFSFKVGEKSQYDLYYNWGFIWINAATVDFTVKEKRLRNTPVYELQMASKTKSSFKAFNIRDTLKSYVNKKTLNPYLFIQLNYEDKYYSKNKFNYFSNNDKWGVYVEKERKRGTRYDTIVSETRFFDIITTLYRFRNINPKNLVVNQKIPMPMVFDDGVYDLYLRYVGKEKIELKNGKTYNCLKLKPLLAEGKMFEQGEGMTIWVSDDANLIPVMVESKLKVGSIKAVLTNVQNHKYPMISQLK